MASLVLDVAVRAILIAAGTAAVLWVLRIKTPAVRHAAWTAVVVAMLLLPIWSIAGPKLSLPVLEPAAAPVKISSVPETVSAPVTVEPDVIAPAASSPIESPRTISTRDVLAGIYLIGVSVLFVRLVIGTLMANRLRRRAVIEDGRATSADCATPITVGWLAPVLILPRGWQRWSDAQLSVVLTHEREHVRRRDPLVQWIALFNRAVFWFHPLSWWLERRLAVLAEEACDEAVLAAGHSPEAYSAYLLDLARAVTREGHRVEVVGTAMPGGALSERIRRMFNGVPIAPVSRARVVSTVAFCVVSSAIFAAGTLAHRRDIQSVTTTPLKFDVASIKPCAPGSGQEPSRRGGAGASSPGYLHLDCMTLRQLLNIASGNTDVRLNATFRNRADGDFVAVRGGPAWVAVDSFTIEAKLEGVTNRKILTGAPLLALLEDRFQLKFHRATEARDVYALTVTPGGPKLQPLAPGSCYELDPAKMPGPGELNGLQMCGMLTGVAPFRADGAKIGTLPLAVGTSLADFLSSLMDRVVVDKTGLDARYDVTFDYTPNEATPGAIERLQRARWGGPSKPMPTGGPTIFKALENLGLKLTPAKEPVGYLVIDRVEKLRSDNDVVPAAAPAAPAAPAPAAAPQAAPQPSMQIKFDVVSIKPCEGSGDPAARGGGAGPAARSSVTPGYALLACQTLTQLIDVAYGGGSFPGNSLLNTLRLAPNSRPDLPKRVRGGPSWVDEERFTLEIRLSGDTTDLTGSARHNVVLTAMAAPMRALLEDRFQLKVRKVTEQVPMYAMTVAPGGLKIPQTAKAGEKCWEPLPATSRAAEPVAPPGSEGQPPCRYRLSIRNNAGNKVWMLSFIGLTDFAKVLSETVDRYVLDQTGVDGRFSFNLEYASDDRTPGDTHDPFARIRAERGAAQPPGNGPNIFKALELLGLKLESTKGPAEHLAIESAQRPRPDFAAVAAPVRAMGGGQ